jgi:Ni/Co efflux regulator RcnB
MKLAAAIALALLLATPALAQGQGHGQGQGRGQGGGGHGGGHGQQQHGQGQGQGQGHGGRIADADRGLIQGYFGQQFAQGNCPPGLAKKNNGCQPPGQARKWAVGQRLPDGLGYPLPPELLRRLAPPAGHTYMRVGTDIVMIAVGTGMVVSGLANLLQ